MKDLNKLRSEFEAIPEIKPHLDHGNVFWSDKNQAYASEFQCLHVAACYVNGAWFMFQEKAKAQAVPVWISSDFMKPDEGDLVLGISATKLAKFNVYQVVALDEFDECEINYWMPLPTAPSESGAEG